MLETVKRNLFQQFRQSETRLHELNYLFWECTVRCNLNCLHCGSDCSKIASVPDMPLTDFLAALDTINHKSKNFTVVFTGGEPLLRKDIDNCGFEIRQRGFRWGMVTNGFLYNIEMQNRLQNAGMGALTISLDGLAESHNRLRNNPLSFDKACSAIEIAATASRLNFDVVTCVNPWNINELESLYQLLVGLNVKAWRLFTIAPMGRAASNQELFLNSDQFDVLMKFIATKRQLHQNDIKFSCEAYVGKYELKVRDVPFFCRAGINIGSVLIDGSISACPNIDRNFVQGNIYKDNFFDVWQHRFDVFRNRDWNKTGICATCNEYKYCAGNGFHYRECNNPEVMVCRKTKE